MLTNDNKLEVSVLTNDSKAAKLNMTRLSKAKAAGSNVPAAFLRLPGTQGWTGHCRSSCPSCHSRPRSAYPDNPLPGPLRYSLGVMPVHLRNSLEK